MSEDTLLFRLAILTALALLMGWAARAQIRSILRTENKKPPHERWPEVLHWQQGDEFDELPFDRSRWTKGKLVSVREDGNVYLNFCGDCFCVPISLAIGHNQSLRNRRIEANIKEDDGYMELLRQFQLSYKELQQRDKQNGITN